LVVKEPQKAVHSSHTQKNKRTAVGKRGKNCEEPQKIAKILPRHQKYRKLYSNKRAEPIEITKITKHPSQNSQRGGRLNWLNTKITNKRKLLNRLNKQTNIYKDKSTQTKTFATKAKSAPTPVAHTKSRRKRRYKKQKRHTKTACTE
jgi:hypothetical protein